MPSETGEECSVLLSVEGMHCSSCALLIDQSVEEVDGVISSRTSLRRGRTLVMFESSRTTPDEVVRSIADLGYRARISNERRC